MHRFQKSFHSKQRNKVNEKKSFRFYSHFANVKKKKCWKKIPSTKHNRPPNQKITAKFWNGWEATRRQTERHKTIHSHPFLYAHLEWHSERITTNMHNCQLRSTFSTFFFFTCLALKRLAKRLCKWQLVRASISFIYYYFFFSLLP